MELLRDKTKKDAYMNSTVMDMFKRGELRRDHPQQRKPEQWNNQTRDGFIATVIKQEDVNPIIICEQLKKTGVTLWVIDGLQRLTYLDKYKNNGFKLGKSLEMPIVSYQVTKMDEKGGFAVDEEGNHIYKTVEFDLRGKGYEELPKQLKERFDNYQIDMVKHLDCTDEEIGYHIRRYNRQTSMNPSQDSVTYMDHVAKYVKGITNNNRFFKDCGSYTEKERNKGVTDRIVMESIMCMFHLEHWQKQSKKMGAFLNANSSKGEFDRLDENICRLTEIYSEDFQGIFTAKDSFLWFTLFDRFISLGLEDVQFGEFLMAFKKRLCNKKVNGRSFYDIDRKGSTKDKSVIKKKLDHLETLLFAFLHLDKKDIEDKDSFRFIKANVAPHIIPEDLELYGEVLDSLLYKANPSSQFLDKQNRPSLLAIVGYSFCRDIDLDEWMVDFFHKNNTYIRNQKENYLYMKKELDRYIDQKNKKSQETGRKMQFTKNEKL